VVYSVNGNSIVRTEDGAITAIASSTDQLIDQVTDVQLANTGYLSSVVTFLPIFTSNGVATERGTTVIRPHISKHAARRIRNAEASIFTL
jgi:hypothetical protein